MDKEPGWWPMAMAHEERGFVVWGGLGEQRPCYPYKPILGLAFRRLRLQYPPGLAQAVVFFKRAALTVFAEIISIGQVRGLNSAKDTWRYLQCLPHSWLAPARLSLLAVGT